MLLVASFFIKKFCIKIALGAWNVDACLERLLEDCFDKVNLDLVISTITKVE